MKPKDQVKPGDIIHINSMFGEPQYTNKEGVVKEILGKQQIIGTWGDLPLFFTDNWEVVGKSNNKVLEFIHRRFQKDSDWLSGNCYYFALILKDRFPEGIICYDVIDGHFVVRIDGVEYDWSGVTSKEGYHYYIEWDRFEEYDSSQRKRIVEDCIL